MSADEKANKVYNFLDLIEQNKIEIPIIQRDYAQGREDKTELRIDFLKALKNSMVGNNVIYLDFIYGSSDNQVMQPLDGQQRLTTLFLLYWYSLILNNDLTSKYYKILLNFSYETRISSREFCNALINNPFYLPEDAISISEIIKDMPWYFLSWKKDPTIDAMLRTIDDIHNLFSSEKNLMSKLFIERNHINFYYIELENFGLSDDLYIKMNARGKSLSSFENFKATFEKLIIDSKWEKPTQVENSFALKVDTVWMKMLWKHRLNNSVDSAFMRLFSTALMIQLTLNKNVDRFRKLVLIQGDANRIRAHEFDKDGFLYLKKLLNVYQKYLSSENNLDLDFPFWQHLGKANIFETIVLQQTNPSYTQRVLFFAQTEYLLLVEEFNREKFNDWMRVVRNFVSLGSVSKTGARPAIVRSPDAFDGMISLIRELAKGCDDIYNYLPHAKIKSSIAKEQLEEERQKSSIIINNPSLKEIIFDAEDRNLLMGRISVLFDALGYDNNPENFDSVKFKKYISIFKEYFDSDILDIIRRGLLCMCDENGRHNYFDYWWSYSYAVEAEKRCLIASFRELEYFFYGAYNEKNHFKKYFLNLLNRLVDQDIESIIEGFEKPEKMPLWEYKLIKDSSLLNHHCESKYFAIKKDRSGVYLFRGVRPRNLDGCYEVNNELTIDF